MCCCPTSNYAGQTSRVYQDLISNPYSSCVAFGSVLSPLLEKKDSCWEYCDRVTKESLLKATCQLHGVNVEKSRPSDKKTVRLPCAILSKFVSCGEVRDVSDVFRSSSTGYLLNWNLVYERVDFAKSRGKGKGYVVRLGPSGSVYRVDDLVEPIFLNEACVSKSSDGPANGYAPNGFFSPNGHSPLTGHLASNGYLGYSGQLCPIDLFKTQITACVPVFQCFDGFFEVNVPTLLSGLVDHFPAMDTPWTQCLSHLVRAVAPLVCPGSSEECFPLSVCNWACPTPQVPSLPWQPSPGSCPWQPNPGSLPWQPNPGSCPLVYPMTGVGAVAGFSQVPEFNYSAAQCTIERPCSLCVVNRYGNDFALMDHLGVSKLRTDAEEAQDDMETFMPDYAAREKEILEKRRALLETRATGRGGRSDSEGSSGDGSSGSSDASSDEGCTSEDESGDSSDSSVSGGRRLSMISGRDAQVRPAQYMSHGAEGREVDAASVRGKTVVQTSEKKSGVSGVIWHKGQEAWVASYNHQGRRIRRSFPAKIHGEEEALRLAVECRQQSIMSGKASLQNRSEYQSGVVGVAWHEDKRAWHARYCLGGRRVNKYFPLANYDSPACALEAAKAFRKEMEEKHYVFRTSRKEGN